jgi:hypothetical protein
MYNIISATKMMMLHERMYSSHATWEIHPLSGDLIPESGKLYDQLEILSLK